MISRVSRAAAPTVAALVTAATLAAGCSGSSPAPAPPTVIAFSDIHFDPLFDLSLLPQLEARPATEWPEIFASSVHHTTPGGYGDTTNAVLLQRALSAIQAQQPPPAFVVFGGDLLVQGLTALYLQIPGTDEAGARAFTLKATTYVVNEIRSTLGATPVYFTLGNWDNYTGSFGLVPGDPYLADTSDLFLDGLLADTTDRQGFEVTYRTGGYYAAGVPGTNLVVVGLNDLFFIPQPASSVTPAINPELDWLAATLTAVEASGRRAFIVTHVPPGGDLVTSGDAVNPQGQLTQATMLLAPQPQERLLAILAAHRVTVAGVFTGHTHMDQYRISTVPMQGIPGITSDMGNGPAFKVFTASAGWTLQDYVSWNIDLSSASATFQPWYDFATAYDLPTPLGPSLAALVPQLHTSATAQAGYRERFGSGHAPSKPITDLNWPVYRCGVTAMTAQGLMSCVNGP